MDEENLASKPSVSRSHEWHDRMVGLLHIGGQIDKILACLCETNWAPATGRFAYGIEAEVSVAGFTDSIRLLDRKKKGRGQGVINADS